MIYSRLSEISSTLAVVSGSHRQELRRGAPGARSLESEAVGSDLYLVAVVQPCPVHPLPAQNCRVCRIQGADDETLSRKPDLSVRGRDRPRLRPQTDVALAVAPESDRRFA